MAKPVWIWQTILLLGIGGNASAQGAANLIPASYDFIKGAPFTARIETTWKPPEVPSQPAQQQAGLTKQPLKSIVMRDSAGRQRYQSAPSQDEPTTSQPDFAVIYDIPGQRVLRLFFKARTYTEERPPRMGVPIQIDPSRASSAPPKPLPAGRKLLGIQTIAGLEAWGQEVVTTSTQPDGTKSTITGEVWFSTHYRIAVKLVRPDGPRGTLTEQIVSFDPHEPDPALFTVPAGFTRVGTPIIPPQLNANGVYRIGNGILPPRPIKMPDPDFSEQAKRDKVGGNVLIYLVVDEKGLPTKTRVIRGIGHGLDEKAIEAVKRYRFKPAILNGTPVPVEMNVEVNFTIF